MRHRISSYWLLFATLALVFAVTGMLGCRHHKRSTTSAVTSTSNTPDIPDLPPVTRTILSPHYDLLGPEMRVAISVASEKWIMEKELDPPEGRYYSVAVLEDKTRGGAIVLGFVFIPELTDEDRKDILGVEQKGVALDMPGGVSELKPYRGGYMFTFEGILPVDDPGGPIKGAEFFFPFPGMSDLSITAFVFSDPASGEEVFKEADKILGSIRLEKQ